MILEQLRNIEGNSDYATVSCIVENATSPGFIYQAPSTWAKSSFPLSQLLYALINIFVYLNSRWWFVTTPKLSFLSIASVGSLWGGCSTSNGENSHPLYHWMFFRKLNQEMHIFGFVLILASNNTTVVHNYV